MIIFAFIVICILLYAVFKLSIKKHVLKKNKKNIYFSKRNLNDWMNLTKKERYNLSKKDSASYLDKRKELLNKIDPLMGGGEMISDVTFEKTSYADLPHKFEAGTPNISGVIAFGVAIDYLNKIGFNNIEKYELELLDYATTKLKKIDGLKIYGDVKNKTSVISFNIIGIHSYDIGSILDKYGVAVRTGQHCAQPIMDYFNIPGTVRVSLSFLNTFDEIDILCEALLKAKSMLS